MKILIDGCVFTQHNQTTAILFWKKLIAALVFQLQGEQIYFLNRTSNLALPDVDGLKNLFSPDVDFEQSALEHCRLSALCKELEVDSFISTYNTSIGFPAKSMLLLGKMLQPTSKKKDSIWISRQRAIKMACGYLFLDQSAAESLKTTGIWNGDLQSESEGNRVFYCIDKNPDLERWSESDWHDVAKQLSLGLQELGNRQLSTEVLAQVQAEDEAAKVRSQQVKLKAEEAVKTHAIYPNYDPNFSQKSSTYPTRKVRIYNALKQPRRYPEYVTRLYQWLAKKVSL